MLARSLGLRLLGASLLLGVLVGGTRSPLDAQQQRPLRPGQSPGPRFIVPTLRAENRAIGDRVADEVRQRIASGFDMRALWVVPESTVTAFLRQSGYSPTDPLTPSELRQLAASFRADEYIDGAVSRTPEGAFRVEINWALVLRDDMVQPLPPVEAAKIEDAAKLVSQEFRAARRQIESVRSCMDLARAGNTAGALVAAREAIEAYPRSALARVCIANIYHQQKLGPDSMIRISEEILAIHPQNRRALAFAADAYAEKGMADRQIASLRALLALDSTSRQVQSALARALAQHGRAAEARPVIDAAVAQYPDDAELLRLRWRILLALEDWPAATAAGKAMVAADSSAADADFFVRMAAAFTADSQPAEALTIVERGTARFPAHDELATLHVQLLRQRGALQQSLEAADRLIERNPKATNAWLQRARTQAELNASADSVVVSLARGVEHGEVKATVAGYAATLGQAAYRAGTQSKQSRDLRTAVRYLAFAEEVESRPAVAFLLGASSLALGELLYEEGRATRSCEIAREAQSALTDAEINLPRGGRAYPEQAASRLARVKQMLPYAEQLQKGVCR